MKDRRAVRRWRLLGVVAAVAATIGVLSLPALASAASAGLKPSEAPLVEVGQHYFGNTNNTTREYPVELWRLPPLLTDDAITVVWHAHYAEVGGPGFCLTQNIDDINWAEGKNVCNASEGYGVPDYGDGSARSVVEVRAITSDAFLEFRGCGPDCEFGTYNGAYDFVIESIQHAIGVSLAPVGLIQPTATLTARANLSSGQPVPDGFVFTLTASWVTPSDKASHEQSFTASSIGGGLSFPLSLPTSAEGQKLTLVVSRPADAEYREARSEVSGVEVIAPPAPPPPPVGTASVAGTAKVRHGAATLTLTCTGGPCNGGFKLRAHYKERRVIHRHGLRRVVVHKRIAVVGRSAFSIPANQTNIVAVPLSRKGKELLRRSKRQHLSVMLAGHGVDRGTIVLRGGRRDHTLAPSVAGPRNRPVDA